MRTSLLIALVTVLIVMLKGEYWYLGFQMSRQCEKEAGIKIYETVELPRSSPIGQYRLFWAQSMPSGRPDGSWFSRTSDDAYRMIWTTTYLIGTKPRDYEQGNTLSKSHTGIYRWSDKKLLGEEIYFVHHYSCLFCDAPAPHRTCRSNKIDLTTAVFKNAH